MVRGKSIALTALVLLLAGVLGFGCAKRKDAESQKLHGILETFEHFSKVYERSYYTDENARKQIDSFKPQECYGNANRYFQLGRITQAKLFATHDLKLVDSIMGSYNKMFASLDEKSDSRFIFPQKDINSCRSNFITYGPSGLYFDLTYLTQDPQYADSTEKYLNLAQSANNSETPNNVLSDQKVMRAELKKFCVKMQNRKN